MCVIRSNETRSNSGRINKHMTISFLDERWPMSSHGIMSAFSRPLSRPSSPWNPRTVGSHAGVFFFIYTVRAKRLTFGFSTFGGFGRVMGMAMGLFKRKNKMAVEVREEM